MNLDLGHDRRLYPAELLSRAGPDIPVPPELLARALDRAFVYASGILKQSAKRPPANIKRETKGVGRPRRQPEDAQRSPQEEFASFGGHPTIEVPARLLCRLYNSLSDQDLRDVILDYIARYKWVVSKRGHAAEGFSLVAGRLSFDDDLYSEAVYRGKTSTYLGAAAEAMKRLRSEAEMVAHMSQRHAEANSVSKAKAAARVAREVPTYEELAPDFVERTFGLPRFQELQPVLPEKPSGRQNKRATRRPR